MTAEVKGLVLDEIQNAAFIVIGEKIRESGFHKVIATWRLYLISSVFSQKKKMRA